MSRIALYIAKLIVPEASMEVLDEVKPIDRVSLESVVSRAHSMTAETKGPEAPDPVAQALQNFRNKLLLLVAENARTLLDLDSQARPVLESVDSVVSIPGAGEKLFPLIGVLQAAVRSIYKQNESLGKGSNDAELINMASCIATASKRMFDACEAARWKLLEAEADADIAAGRHHGFPSMDAALASLRRDD